MERYILFRTRKIRTLSTGINQVLHHGRGSDFGDMTNYLPGDDTRDISWKHSARTGVLKKKMRLEESVFPILIENYIGEDDGFFTLEHPISVVSYTSKIISDIKTSAKKYHFPMVDNPIRQKYEARNTMIFYITHTLDIANVENIAGLAQFNDLIVLHVFHPYEVTPDEERIIDGYGIDMDSYRQDFILRQKSIQEYVLKQNASYLLMSTQVDIIACINNFFKTRF